MKTLSTHVNEALSKQELTKKFDSLNRKYKKIDKAMDKADGQEYDAMLQQLEDIQTEMSKLSAQLEEL